MVDSVLVISLGRSPPVVTETVDALLEMGVNLRRVYCVSTSDEAIQTKCIPLLEAEFRNYPEYVNRRIEFNPWNFISNKDIETQEDHLEFVNTASSIMKREEDRGSDIYLSMAGGRKTMSAAMAILAQIYSARAITHVLVPTEIERKGVIDVLEKIESEEERRRILHLENKNLILFPVIGIASLRNEIIQILKKQGGTYDKKVLEILKTSNFVDSNGNPTPLGKEYLKILEDIEDTPPISTKKPSEKWKISHKPISKNLNQFVQKIAECPYVELVQDIEYEPSPKTKIKSVEDTKIIAQVADGSKSVILKIYTTAKTQSQVKKIKKELSPLFK
ncbi:MAG: CRISPR-associated ring nuclease [Candidatus Jordarchaeum sp.]|uniref:CRISPR-associated ring nuclease n=1 Tax=Candidatus Jordarchaeum sp. TaxID=2823881 RepID=UPI00404A8C69